jgi:general secretion pathway protein C
VFALFQRFRIAGALCVVVCASLAARAVAQNLDDDSAGPTHGVSPQPHVAPPPPAVPPGPAPVESPVEPMGAGDPSPLPVTAPVDAAPVPTRAPLVLVATNLSTVAEESYATIRHNGGHGEGAYWLGQRVPGAGVIEKVGGMYVLLRTDAGRLEKLELNVGTPAAEPPGKAAPPPSTAGGTATVRNGGGEDWSNRIKKIDEDSYEVERQLIRDLVGQGTRLKGVRMMPVMKDGQISGMKVSMARKDSLAAAVGLRTGDVIEAVNGTKLTTAEAALAMYGQLETTSMVTVTVQRGGQPVNLEYKLR